jgi:hypothetical protein
MSYCDLSCAADTDSKEVYSEHRNENAGMGTSSGGDDHYSLHDEGLNQAV